MRNTRRKKVYWIIFEMVEKVAVSRYKTISYWWIVSIEYRIRRSVMFSRQLILKSSLEFYKSTNIGLCVHNLQLYNLLITFECIRQLTISTMIIVLLSRFDYECLDFIIWNVYYLNVFIRLSFEGKEKYL